MDWNVLLSSGSTAVIAAYVLQALKKSKWFPWMGIEQAHQTANLLISLGVAGASAVGIHYTYNQATGQLIIEGLTLAGIAHGVAHWAGQFVAQHISYRTLVVPGELQGAIVDELKILQGIVANANQGPKA